MVDKWTCLCHSCSHCFILKPQNQTIRNCFYSIKWICLRLDRTANTHASHICAVNLLLKINQHLTISIFTFLFVFNFAFIWQNAEVHCRKNVTKFKRFHNKNLQFFISFEFVQYENYWIKVRATEGRDQWIESNRKKLSSTVAVSECMMMKPNIFFLTL